MTRGAGPGTYGVPGPALRPLRMGKARRAAFAATARQRFDAHEAMLEPAITAALDAYLALLRERTGMHEQQLAADASPRPGSTQGLPAALRALLDGNVDPFIAQVKSQTSRWGALLDQHVMPAYAKMIDSVLAAGLKDARVRGTLRQWRGEWLAARRQELVGIPDTVTGILRTGLSAIGQAQGTSVNDAELAVRGMLSNGYPSWTARARLIARTETVSSNNQGAIATYSAVADASGSKATKTWLATEDAHTREDHAEVDGTTVGIDEDFSVGGVSMNGPGDPRGGAGQVCNCRCTLTYDFPADEPDSGVDAGDGPTTDDSSDADPDADGLTAATASATDDAAPSPGSVDDSPVNDDQTGPTHAGLAVVAADTGRVLMLQRAMDPADDAAGMWEFPGGGIEDGETPEAGAAREWCEETGLTLPGEHQVTGQWDSANGVYRGFVISVPSEADLALNPDHEDRVIANPDDPNGESTEVTAWFAPADLPAMPSLRPEVRSTPWELLKPESDSPVDDGAASMTAAQEADVTAPPATDAPPSAPAAPAADPSAPAAPDLTPVGITWSGPIALLGVPSSDGRMINGQGLIIRPLPLPLSWQRESGPEHEDSTIVGRVLQVEVRGEQLWAMGDFLDPMINFDVEQAMAQVDAGLGLVSVDLAPLEFGFADADGNPIDPMLWDGDDLDAVTDYLAAEFGGVTIVSFQAFADARIQLDQSADPDALEIVGDPGILLSDPIGTFAAEGETMAGANPESPTIADDGSSITLQDGSTVKVGDSIGYPNPDGGDALVGTISGIDATAATVTVTPPGDDGSQPDDITVDLADLTPAAAPPPGKDGGEALLASSEVRPYKSALFAKRELDGPTPLTVDPETGAVFGHLATWSECHVGKMAESGQCVTAPHSKADYGYFHLSPILTDAGPLDVGKITVGTGHANSRGGFANAVHHYDNTGTAVAVVRAHEDAFGVQVVGQLIHDTPAPRVEELMRSPLSGDWRGMNGNLELTAALAVNVPGFPVRRPIAGMARDKRVGQLSLVAAGMVTARPKIKLPSGALIDSTDMDALVAAVEVASQRARTSTGLSRSDAARRDAARLRLARGRLARSLTASAR